MEGRRGGEKKTYGAGVEASFFSTPRPDRDLLVTRWIQSEVVGWGGGGRREKKGNKGSGRLLIEVAALEG